MEMLPLAFVGGWACGVNTWLTVLVLGVLGRFAAYAEVPDALQRTDVLVVVGLLAALEMVIDKVPLLDTAGALVATVVRPAAGGLLGAMLGGGDGGAPAIVLAAVGGVAALLSHAATRTLRLAAAPAGEPAATVGASVAGDLAAAFAVVGAVLYPVAVAVVVLVVLVLAVLLAIRVRNRSRTGWQRFRRLLATLFTGIRRARPRPGGGTRG